MLAILPCHLAAGGEAAGGAVGGGGSGGGHSVHAHIATVPELTRHLQGTLR